MPRSLALLQQRTIAVVCEELDMCDQSVFYRQGMTETLKISIHLVELIHTPSADLLARGDAHNDESELTNWASNMGYSIQLTYGDTIKEGNIAWALKENIDKEVINGANASLDEAILSDRFGYNSEQIELIMFLRDIEASTRHKDLKIPGISREKLRVEGLVD